MSLANSIFGESAVSSTRQEKNGLAGLFDENYLSEKKSNNVSEWPTLTLSNKRKPPLNDDLQEAEDHPEKSDNDESKKGFKEEAIIIEKNVVSEDLEKENDEDRTVFVGNLPPNTTRKSLANMFKSCGKVASTRLRSVATNTEGVKLPPSHAGNQNLVKKVAVNTHKLLDPNKSLQGYVVFEDSSSVSLALKMNNMLLADGSYLRVDTSKPTMDATRSVFVGNLPYTADESSLRLHFTQKGDDDGDGVVGVRIVRDSQTMLCKGFGYVLLHDRSLVPAALKLHNTIYQKKHIRVMVCSKRFNNKEHHHHHHNGVGTPKNDAVSNSTYSVEKKESSGAQRRTVERAKKRAIPDSNSGPNKRKRGVKKVGMDTGRRNGGGVSKRVAADKKADKRMKKIQKRVSKGMGKFKHV